MPKFASVTLPTSGPALLSLAGSSVAEITVQNQGTTTVKIIPVSVAGAPDEDAPGWNLLPGDIIFSEDCAKVFQGITPVAFYGYAYGKIGKVNVDHA